ncbi:amino acid permease [Raineyella fluvialis]|uniref:Amino acid permease n=1 Tax=Raineyella fluvialis TaxID=2662261 RepID=A0A5Q2F8P5_9ACTN|nr:amino acid permease [Raineyella fluvialis]QGF22811.1 amino acid permease [Raineyella fluvialis]
MSLFVKKTIGEVQEDLEDPERSLRRVLSAWDIAVMGIAVAVGAGIFSVGAQAAAKYAGPSVIVSFIIAAVVCGLAVMNYAEFASTIPVSGSAYTFSYVSLGELIAWIIGWDLILEMMMAASVISKYWGIYLSNVFQFLHVDLPTDIPLPGGLAFSWPPVLIVALFTVLLVLGTKLTSRVNGVLTVIKIAITLFIIVAGSFYVKLSNLTPFVPPSQPSGSDATGVMTQSLFAFLSGAEPTRYGAFGLLSAAALVFFAFIGFDVVATTAEEAKNPQRTLPRGIFGGLALVTVLYVAVTFVVTGMVSYKQLAAEKSPSLATAFRLVGANWVGTIITIGILIGLTTVIMVLLLGLARVVFAMSRDGLLPRGLSHTSRRGTPARLQIISGVIVAVIAGLANVDQLAEMINIGTLSAFVLVSFAIPVLRRRHPDLPRGFTVPWSPTLPIISGVLCLWLMANLAVETWLRFVVWLLLGLTLYFAYSYRNSRARQDQALQAEGDGSAGPWGLAAAVLVGVAALAIAVVTVMRLAGPGGLAGLSGGLAWILILAPVPGIVAGHVALTRTGSAGAGTRTVLTTLATGYGAAAVAVVFGIVHVLAVL